MRLFRMILAGLIGFPLLVIGIILIPLPGPGLLVCFVALFILSLGFERAQIYLDTCRRLLREVYKKAKARADKIEHLGDK